MTRFMRFWRRLGIVLLVAGGLLAAFFSISEPYTDFGLWLGVATIAGFGFYLGVGWAIDAFFQKDEGPPKAL